MDTTRFNDRPNFDDIKPREGSISKECTPSRATESVGGTLAQRDGAVNVSDGRVKPWEVSAYSGTRPSLRKGRGRMRGALGGPDRAAIYLRVSSEQQGEGNSLAGQLKECREYCTAKGYRVVRILQDKVSGFDGDRPAWNRLLALAGMKAFDTVVVWRRDRFGRDPLHNAIADRELKRAGIRFEAINTGRLEETDENEFLTTVLDAMARYEARKTAARCQLGRNHAAFTGHWPCKPPFGYKRNEEGWLEPFEPEAERVRAAYRAYLRGANKFDVGDAMGCSYKEAIRRLKLPTYKGQARYGSYTVPVPALVDAATWDAVQDAIKARAHGGGRHAAPFTKRARDGRWTRGTA